MGKTIQVYGFPGLIPAETIKEFLEGLTGKGTVYALEVKQAKKGGSRAYAKVQFTTVNSADHVQSLASKRLWYGRSYLKAFASDTDIIQKPKVYACDVERVALFIGCQVSKEKFSVLWKKADISVKFGFSLRKLYFFLEYQSVDYKLELSYENIWQTELRRSQTGEFLLIQLIGAPRIFQKYEEESVYSFMKETPDEQWIRATDFTPSSCIGQSSGFCLKLPNGVSIPQFADYFAYYKENRGPFNLESGYPFSHNLTLVPIVGPSSGLQLPYNILFKLSMLVQGGFLPGPVLDGNFFSLVDPLKLDIVMIERALEKLCNLKDCCYEPVKWLTEQYKNYLMLKRPPKSPSIVLDNGLVYVRRVLITPTRVYFYGPEINMSNRVLRHYSNDIDSFLRVSFVDEELDKMHSTNLSIRIGSVEKRTAIYQRILSILRDGIDIVGTKFEFLAFSSSQLRENSAWMFASRRGLTAADIRKWMGDFSEIKNVAKYAARLGQSFGSSTETLSVPHSEIETIRDIKVVTNGTEYTFSDGIGKISADFAHRVAIKCGLKVFTPSAFQIRYGGYKGVVAIDPTSSVKLSFRKSMSKYESLNDKLDVLGWSKYQPCFLNRQLISLLSTLGVEDYIFEIKQKDALKQLDSILTDPLMAQEALELMSPGENTNILKEMLLCGYMPDKEPFLSMMLRTFRAAKLLELRTKTRIFIPKARQMMGCLDETRTLEYGQVFVQFSGGPSHRHFGDRSSFLPNTESEHRRFIANGKILVAKNPCLHPGDVRVLLAVDVPALRHMVDCVVFPQKGKRPHPNECSGSDLDGDVYFVCWDKDLIPRQQIEPMDYTPAPSTVLDHDVTIEEVEEYFTNYILNDSLGVIANAHTVFADSEPLKALSKPCLELAQLFSIAVDFPKTGVPAEIPSHLRVKVYPDFMEKPDKPTYDSVCVIGKLFRMVKVIAPHDPTSATKSFFTREMARKSYDAEMEVEGFEDYVEDAFDYKNEYDFKLGNLMDYYGIKTEAEILGGSIMRMSKTFDRRKDADAVGLAVRSLRKEARAWFNKKSYNEEGEEIHDDLLAKASAWYHVTYHYTYWGRYNEGMDREHFLSFPWCVYDKLVHIKKYKVSVERLQQEFNQGLLFN